MDRTNVVLLYMRGQDGIRWMLRRNPDVMNAGWARYDGTFTPGSHPQLEAESQYVVSSPLRDEMIEFADDHGWHIMRQARP